MVLSIKNGTFFIFPFYMRKQPQKNKKCRMCSTVYTGSLYACPSCDSSLYEETTEEQLSINNYQLTKEEEEVKVSDTDIGPDSKKTEIERLEKLFDATSDEKEKSLKKIINSKTTI